jgi:hypothetical protein
MFNEDSLVDGVGGDGGVGGGGVGQSPPPLFFVLH